MLYLLLRMGRDLLSFETNFSDVSVNCVVYQDLDWLEHALTTIFYWQREWKLSAQLLVSVFGCHVAIGYHLVRELNSAEKLIRSLVHSHNVVFVVLMHDEIKEQSPAKTFRFLSSGKETSDHRLNFDDSHDSWFSDSRCLHWIDLTEAIDSDVVSPFAFFADVSVHNFV